MSSTGSAISPYDKKPDRLLTQIIDIVKGESPVRAYCAGFELNQWRCNQLADHLIEWLPDYALKEDELLVNHGNMYVRLREAAVRIYSTEKFHKRGEVGEVILHAVCRDFFGTVPLTPRVFYLTSSNDVVKSFDLVHIRYDEEGEFELWLGESKLWEKREDAVADAIKSINTHIEQGFLHREKLLVGPQISKWLPRYQEVRRLFSEKETLDKLFKTAVFPVCISSDSESISNKSSNDDGYIEAISGEIDEIWKNIEKSNLLTKIRIILFYIPLESKAKLLEAFDKRLKGLTP